MMPEKTIERLTLYRRVLQGCAASERAQVYSYELARLTGSSAAQVRRDLMAIGASGSCRNGYEIPVLLGHVESILDNPSGQSVILVGVGHLGHALIAFFTAYRPNLRIVAALDRDPDLIGQRIHDCPVHALDELEAVVSKHAAAVAILAVGKFTKEAGEAFGISAFRRANILDVTVCTYPFLLPFFIPTILAASTTAGYEAFGMPRLSAWTIGLHNAHSWALLVIVLVAIGTGWGRAKV